jgi:malate dehydrogenase (oxaloacetate-decarboxylating)
MKRYSIDTVLRVRLKHRPGQLARFATAVAGDSAVLGNIDTVKIGEDDTVRDITVETEDEAHTQRVVATVRALPDVELLSVTDRVFERHRGGKLHATSRVKLETVSDLRYIYTPGVARVALAIQAEPERARELTGLGNSVGIFTNGTRVLGLGNIGALASLPVMEGKAVLYDRLAGISATPLLVDTTDPEAFIDTVERLAPSFGAIHLEDIRIPDCYRIEDELKRRLARPVMHDDQHGTATVSLAAMINACRLRGIDPRRARIGQIGLGAAGGAIAALAMVYGVGEMLVTDPSPDAVARLTVKGARAVDLGTIMESCDIVVATTGRPGLITPEMVRKGQVILALSNPEPEIRVHLALGAGAAVASDGRIINNALAFPGLFKGALQARSRAITPGMMIAAAQAIAACAEAGELVPAPLDPVVHDAVCGATVARADAEGLRGTARLK